MEASALHAPAGLARLPLGPPLLRLRSDEQLLALFRAGSDDAFGAIHDRYRQRLFAYVRQMLCAGPRQDAEDVLQDVFVRAYGALRADAREVNLRAWLYRVAHNRCIDHLRRPVPPAADVFDLSRKPLHDPIEEAQRREDLARLVADVGRLPEQQRSALLMREIDGMSYVDLAGALDVTVPAVKSLLVRARIGLVEAAEARDADCEEIRVDLLDAYDRGVKASSRARRHMRTCDGCREYRTALRGMPPLVRRAQPGRRRSAGDGRREAAGPRRRRRRRGRGGLGGRRRRRGRGRRRRAPARSPPSSAPRRRGRRRRRGDAPRRHTATRRRASGARSRRRRPGAGAAARGPTTGRAVVGRACAERGRGAPPPRRRSPPRRRRRPRRRRSRRPPTTPRRRARRPAACRRLAAAAPEPPPRRRPTAADAPPSRPRADAPAGEPSRRGDRHVSGRARRRRPGAEHCHRHGADRRAR